MISKSPFSPNNTLKIVKIKGINIYTSNVGFKKRNDDLLIVLFKNLATVSGVLTKSSIPAAPVKWCRKILNYGKCKVLIVNSGVANAYTGAKGDKSVAKVVSCAAKKFECKAKEIYFSSTGVIGEYLKYSKINNEVERLNDKKEKLFINAARAIMTTDTFPKIAKRRIKLNNRIIDICGIAKGSGMIKPNMATMLAYIFIDAKVKKNALDEIISESAEDTFNSITVDGETSTNDSVLLFSLDNNQNNKTITKNHINYKRIKHNIRLIMEDLCKQIVMDGEGISKFVTINIRSAKNILQAKNIAFAIGNSPLVKTAIAGEDPNWGRVVAAIGKSGEKISADKLKIKFGKFEICKNGCVVKNYNEKKVKLYMRKNKIEISVDLGVGKISKKIWTTDLTKKYIDINADYRS